MARPRKTIDKAKLIQLAELGLASGEIASILDVSIDTIERRFMKELNKGREKRNASLRRKQYEIALSGNPTMLIWLGKQFLGQKDKHEHSGELKIKRVLLSEKTTRLKPSVPEKPEF